MIFNEIYSVYYQVVAKIIEEIIRGDAEEKHLDRIVREYAFSESMQTVLPALKGEKWQLMRRDRTTPIQHPPTMPLTLIQKQWLKAITLDPRIQLFDVEIRGLEEVEPLFTSEDYVVYDKYGDGDPFEDEGYITRFRTILSALKERQALKIQMVNRRGQLVLMQAMPVRLEYSEKDDKFRLISTGCRYGGTVNLGRIVSCEKCETGHFASPIPPSPVKRWLTLRIRDERNTLERCLLHFAHFKKQAERMDANHYLVHIQYDKDDETEMIIRILSFGPMVEVIQPEPIRKLMIERLQRQKSCGLF